VIRWIVARPNGSSTPSTRRVPLASRRRSPRWSGSKGNRFRERGFIINEEFATALQITLALEKPLLIEGPAGVGKTESAKVLAEVLGTELIRRQCYEGLDAMSALYEWNYPRQMLHARLSENEGSSLEEREAYMFSDRFLLKRPLLDAITRDRSPVLLIDEVDRADEAFEAFLLEVLAEWQVTIPELGTIRASQAARGPHEQSHPRALGCVAASTPIESTGDELDEAAIFAPSSYSPLDADAAAPPELPRVERAWSDAARSFVRRLHLGLSRRWRPATRGRRFDLRRTLRAGLQTGGEALSPRWLRRPRRTPRFVLLIDGSRSMSAHTGTALQIAVALATATKRIEVFTFSTGLQRVTDDVRRATAGERRYLDRLHHAWAGGTSIGTCLRDFLRRFGDRMVGRDTVAMITSDGLDVGTPDLLRDAMRELHGRAAGVVWLNPLLETEGYEPTAAGMRIARPYVTTFTSVSDASGLARLSRTVGIR
jgi:uncharacterized protein with von Willebrand factor type A (vWA) domain